MKKRDRKELGRYVRHCADEMGLRDWTIELAIDTPSVDIDEYDASVIDATMECVNGQKLGVLCCPASIRARDREQIRHTVVHELTHCHFAELFETGSHFLRQLGPTATAAADWSYRLSMERAVDAIAREWSRHLPLVDWPD